MASADVVTRIRKARLELLEKHPFLGSLVLSLTITETEHVHTLAVTPKGQLLVNPKNVAKLFDDPTLMFGVCHEVWHLVQGVFKRAPEGAVWFIWNLAADVMANIGVLKMGLPLPPFLADFMTPEITKKYWNSYTEQVYRDFMKDAKIICPKCGQDLLKEGGGGEGKEESEGNGAGGAGKQHCDHGLPHNPMRCESGHDSEKLSEDQQETWKQRLLVAQKIAKDKGNCPAAADELLLNITDPKIPWQRYLRRSITTSMRGRTDWRNPNRRSAALGFFYPSRRPTAKTPIICFDCSGSMSIDELSEGGTEALGIMKACGAKEILAYFHDVVPYHKEIMTPATIHRIRHSGGGTSHVPLFKELCELNPLPGLVICFTDLFTSFPEEAPFPVIWVTKTNHKIVPPFGDVIVMG